MKQLTHLIDSDYESIKTFFFRYNSLNLQKIYLEPKNQ